MLIALAKSWKHVNLTFLQSFFRSCSLEKLQVVYCRERLKQAKSYPLPQLPVGITRKRRMASALGLGWESLISLDECVSFPDCHATFPGQAKMDYAWFGNHQDKIAFHSCSIGHHCKPKAQIILILHLTSSYPIPFYYLPATFLKT